MTAPASARGARPQLGTRRSILFVTDGGVRGGAEAVAAGLLRNLDPSRWRSVVATLEDGEAAEELRNAGLDVRPFPRARLRHPASWTAVAARLTRMARREGVEVVYANHNTALVLATATAAALRVPNCWHLHDPLGGPTVAERVVEHALRTARPDLIVCANAAVAGSLPDRLRRSGRVVVALPGLDRRAIGGGDRRRARSRLGAGPDAVVILCLARLAPSKGQLDLVQAAATLNRPESLLLVVCGPSQQQHRTYEADLRSAVQRHGLEGSVRFTGFVSDSERADLLAGADLLVHPARAENFGLAVAEAMAVGLPVVAADAPGPRSLVDDPHTGLLYPAGDVAALRRCLERALADPDWRRRAGAAGRRAVASLSWQQMAEQIEAALSRVLLGEPPGDRPTPRAGPAT